MADSGGVLDIQKDTKMTLLQASEYRLRLKALEASLPHLGLIERCEVEDEILEIKKALGEFMEVARNNEDECEACGS